MPSSILSMEKVEGLQGEKTGFVRKAGVPKRQTKGFSRISSGSECSTFTQGGYTI